MTSNTTTPPPGTLHRVLCTACRAQVCWVRDSTGARRALLPDQVEAPDEGSAHAVFDFERRAFVDRKTSGWVEHDCPLRTPTQRANARARWAREISERARSNDG